jgi:hypothetical protein
MNLPEFASEAEEARWWFEHRDELAKEFAVAAVEGRLQRGSLARSMGLTSGTPIRLDPADIKAAQDQDEKRG